MKSLPEVTMNDNSIEMSENSSQPPTDAIDHEMEFGIHPVRRPTNIERDVNSLEQKKRVSNILTSPYFKEELETVVTDLLRSGHGGGDVIAKEIANFFSPGGRRFYQGIGCVSPINDLTVGDASLYTKNEKLLRCKLSALCRIVDLFGWSNTIFNHITVRLSQEEEHFLINPFGLLYHEISASKLLKVNMQGDVLDAGSTNLGYNYAGYTLHSAIHASRPDLHCVIHVHGSDVVAVSAMECGLLPLSQEALIVGEVSYHNYQGILVDAKEKKAIQKHLGPTNKVMFLRNHGLVACGETVEEAFRYLYFTMLACKTQVKAMSCMRHDKLILLDRSAMKNRTEEVGKKDISAGKGEGSLKWSPDEMLFESLVRMLDDMGYRSGYPYKNPVVSQRKPRNRSDVEIPATNVNSSAVSVEEIRNFLKRADHSRWVNSPNQYMRVVEPVEEEKGSSASSQNGDASPRTRTKWKRSEEGRAVVGSAVHITNPNQFVPTNTNPRDVLEMRRSIRGQGRWEVNRPGPQSQLLHSVSPDKTAQGDNVPTASKGIIEKGQNVHLVSAAGPPNPFSKISEEELKTYQKEVLADEAEPKESSGGEEKSVEDIQETTTELKEEILDAGEASGISEKQKPLTGDDPERIEEVTSGGDSTEPCQSAPAVESEVEGTRQQSNPAPVPGEAKCEPDEKEGETRGGGSPEVDTKEGGKKSKKRRSLSFLKKKKQKD